MTENDYKLMHLALDHLSTVSHVVTYDGRIEDLVCAGVVFENNAPHLVLVYSDDRDLFLHVQANEYSPGMTHSNDSPFTELVESLPIH